MSDLHETLLEDFFFAPIDHGQEADETPLFSGELDGQSLAEHLVVRFTITVEEAQSAIAAARREVEL